MQFLTQAAAHTCKDTETPCHEVTGVEGVLVTGYTVKRMRHAPVAAATASHHTKRPIQNVPSIFGLERPFNQNVPLILLPLLHSAHYITDPS